jgi:hemolysin III
VHKPATGRFEFDQAELWADGIIHLLGIVLGIIAVTGLILALPPSPSLSDLIPVLVYCSAMLAVLGISAAYNMWPISPVKWWLRRFDHAAIFLLIAGTYTPLLKYLGDGPTPKMLMVIVWAASLAGVTLKIALPGRYDRLSIALYLLIGWSGVFLWDSILMLPVTTLWFLGAGALLYTAGVIFHVWENLRFQNAIWHAFVLAATACHYGAVLTLVTDASAGWS